MTNLYMADSISDEKLTGALPPSNISFENKIKILHNLRARIICEDNSLQGLLTFVPSSVVPDKHPMFEQVAYTNGDEMFFADKFFSMETPVQCAIILHEMFHIVFRHCSRGKKRIGSLFNIACFKPGEPILTLNGYKKIEDLNNQDITLVGGRVTNVMENIYQDNLYSIKAQGCLNIEATKDHPFYVANFNYKKEINYIWKKAEDLNIKKDYLCIPKLKTSNLEILNLDKFIKDFKTFPGRLSKGLQNGLAITKDLLYCMGYYVAEGSLGSNKDYSLKYSLGPNDLHKKNRILSYFSSLGLNPSFKKVKTREKDYTLTVCSSVLGRAFTEWFGRGSENKHLPNWLLELPNELTASFIKGYFDGDGYRSKNKLTAWTKSTLLARQLQLLFAKHNKFLSISYIERNNANRIIRDRSIVKSQKGYLLSYIKCKKHLRFLNGSLISSNSQVWKNTTDYILIPIKNITTEFYKGFVYNIETETHTYLASNVLTHNCDAIINESIGFQGESSIESAPYCYLIKKDAVNLDSLYEEFDIPFSERKHFSGWTAEDLYEYLIKKLKQKLEQQVKDQEKGSKKNKSNSSQPGSTSIPGSNKGGSKQSKPNNSESELEKLEREVEELANKLAKKHKTISGNDIQEGSEGGKDPANAQIDDFIWTQRFNRAKSQSNNSRKSILGKVNPDVYSPQIPWHVELRKYLVKRCMPLTELSYQKPARRMASLKQNRVFLPGLQNQKGLDKMVVIIDTSGSCFNEEELTMFCTEIQNIQEQTNVEIALIFADTEVRSESIVKADGTSLLNKIKMGWIKPAGGGGTDMVAPFVYALKKYRSILTVIASDG